MIDRIGASWVASGEVCEGSRGWEVFADVREEAWGIQELFSLDFFLWWYIWS